MKVQSMSDYFNIYGHCYLWVQVPVTEGPATPGPLAGLVT